MLKRNSFFQRAYNITNQYQQNIIAQEYNRYKFVRGIIFSTPNNYTKYIIGNRIKNYHSYNSTIRKFIFILGWSMVYIITIPFYSFLFLLSHFYVSQKSKTKIDLYEKQISYFQNKINNDNLLPYNDFKIFWKHHGLEDYFSIPETKECLKIICDKLFYGIATFDQICFEAKEKINLHKEEGRKRNPNAFISYVKTIENDFIVETINDYYKTNYTII